MSDKLVCTGRRCGWSGTEPLSAPNPFEPEETLYGCPKCKSVDTLQRACDEPGCVKPASCGTPTPAGYRHTCGEHVP